MRSEMKLKNRLVAIAWGVGALAISAIVHTLFSDREILFRIFLNIVALVAFVTIVMLIGHWYRHSPDESFRVSKEALRGTTGSFIIMNDLVIARELVSVYHRDMMFSIVGMSVVSIVLLVMAYVFIEWIVKDG